MHKSDKIHAHTIMMHSVQALYCNWDCHWDCLRILGNIKRTQHFFVFWSIFASMKILYTIVGTTSLILGIIGIFLPLLPTTPFLLLTAAMYFRSSPRLYYWLIQQKYLGSYIRNFREHKAIPLHAKIVSVSLIWITLSYCAIWILPYIWARILFLILAISTTWHIVSYKTLKQ